MALPTTSETFARMVEIMREIPVEEILVALDLGEMAKAFTEAEPWPHMVYYWDNKARYVPPTHFVWQSVGEGPSDCLWIIPGTLEKRL